MQETMILTNPIRCDEGHKAQWDGLRAANAGLAKILEAVEKPQGTALIFSHDDPDGITSGLIFQRTMEKKGWKTVLHMPVGFMLGPDQLEKALKETPQAKAIFLLDKGTLLPYGEYARKTPVYIIDHHPTPKAPSECVIFNPSRERYTQCSTSLLAHGIATLAGTRDTFDDFLCLVGLKGDWAIEPVKGILADFAKPFFVEYGLPFKNMLRLIHERPTMFDAEQRESTCLLSRISEFVHAVGGGGFQYFYNDREEALKDVDHPQCIATGLLGLAAKSDALTSITTLESFIRLIPEAFREPLGKIYQYFLSDWDKAGKTLNSSVKAVKLGDTSIYLFVGGKVPLLPMIGSIKLFELKARANDQIAQIIMVSSVSPDYTHVSVRGTGDHVHSGKFCGQLQDALKAKYPKYRDFISGGGHPRAAECTIRTEGVSFLNVLNQVSDQLTEMVEIDARCREGKAIKNQKKRVGELGLEYLTATAAGLAN
ncbi:MAG: DHH family phosphoesterase [Candidatus Ozemobacteraceae bacterium]